MTGEIEPDEQQLASAARAGDRRAFEVLLGMHKTALYRFTRRYIGDADDAYDVLQDTLVSAWLALVRYDPAQSFSVWLRAIALNKCRDYGRRHAVRRRILQLLGNEPRNDGEFETDSELQSRRLERLDRAIAALPRKYKEPLLLTLAAGLTQGQAAHELKTSTKAIEMRIRRAKQLLRQELSAASPQGDAVREV